MLFSILYCALLLSTCLVHPAEEPNTNNVIASSESTGTPAPLVQTLDTAEIQTFILGGNFSEAKEAISTYAPPIDPSDKRILVGAANQYINNNREIEKKCSLGGSAMLVSTIPLMLVPCCNQSLVIPCCMASCGCLITGSYLLYAAAKIENNIHRCSQLQQEINDHN